MQDGLVLLPLVVPRPAVTTAQCCLSLVLLWMLWLRTGRLAAAAPCGAAGVQRGPPARGAAHWQRREAGEGL